MPSKKTLSIKISSIKNLNAKIKRTIFLYIVLFFSISSLIACKKEPVTLKAGADHCDQCHMQITDVHFGAEIITSKGRVYKFDSVQCLKDFLLKNKDSNSQVYTVDYFDPDKFIKADEAYFLSDSTIPGPMGPGIVASKNKSQLEKLSRKSLGK